MSEARQAILQALRLGQRPGAGTAIDQWQDSHGPLPALGSGAVERFCAKLEANAASVARAADRGQLVASVMAFLAAQNQVQRLCVAPHPLLAGLQWPSDMVVETRQVEASDSGVLSVAAYGIAESGSLVMVSGEQTPSEANFLPDNFLCVLRGEDILPHPEAVWAKLRGQGPLPAVVNLISGPSRTADVEQTIQLGAHGPRRMHVIVLD